MPCVTAMPRPFLRDSITWLPSAAASCQFVGDCSHSGGVLPANKQPNEVIGQCYISTVMTRRSSRARRGVGRYAADLSIPMLSAVVSVRHGTFRRDMTPSPMSGQQQIRREGGRLTGEAQRGCLAAAKHNAAGCRYCRRKKHAAEEMELL